jgi:NAD(P)-dependent dehydrogenase (short-subunit alcohol dehydrogenase family)
MTKTAVITGGGSGIGQALAKDLAAKGFRVYVVGRRVEKLKQTQQFFPELIVPVAADVGAEEGRQLVSEAIQDEKIDYLVHNAAIVDPLKPVSEFSLQEWRQHVAVNLEGPLFLTQLLLPKLKQGSRILNISSGLAHRAIASTGAYSISKAGLHMLFKVWNEELVDKGILAGSVQPGVVDTGMQVTLRSDDSFENQAQFQSLKDEQQLLSPELVASKISWMLREMSAEQFVEKDWRVTDKGFSPR